jgi:hypothetical protein
VPNMAGPEFPPQQRRLLSAFVITLLSYPPSDK